ncbi:transcription-repair coupling factor [Candidatus Kinetoplastidibacterium desouzai]|uniref:transcription-repair coupling factor n=1 Tax=Candidatus Kinetoplastidibacterium desouzai TaxID=994692 RepID=UPI001F333348|nr:transcription-repair coupling factor [Candidatus Kinetoplastibacterium desouzaii]
MHITKKILSNINNYKKYSYGKPYGSGLSFLIGNIEEQKLYSPIVVITNNYLEAQKISEEIKIICPEKNIVTMPEWETLPYDSFSPNQSIISERLKTFYELLKNKIDILTISINTVINRTIPPEFIASYSFVFKKNDKLDEKELFNQLSIANYKHVPQVKDYGEFCIRGGIIDIFPMGSTTAYRLDLLDDLIDSIRSFDINTQCSTGYVDEIKILPGKEFPYNENSISYFRSNFREYFNGDPSKYDIYKNISNSNSFPGIEYYLPLFFEKTTTIFEYLPKNCLFITLENIIYSIELFNKDVYDRYNFLKHDIENPILHPEKLFLKQEEFLEKLKNYNHLSINKKENNEFKKNIDVSIRKDIPNPIEQLGKLLKLNNNKTIICVYSNNTQTTILNMLTTYLSLEIKSYKSIKNFIDSKEQVGITIAPINYGFECIPLNLNVITENDLYPNRRNEYKPIKQKIYKKNTTHNFNDISELQIGDHIVHSQYGIGIYKGLKAMNFGKDEMEFLHLEYAKDATLYVPISNLNLISRYVGINSEEITLHQLGSESWSKKYKKAVQQIHDTAADLLEIYSKRAIRKGYKFNIYEEDYNKFIDDFGFIETADQAEAIKSVIQDMSTDKPMDRLVCGDVGFGKTEVALRAAFIAASNNKQVIMLCPTTLLAEQHTQTFTKRFSNWPINIAELSRMRSSKENNLTIDNINNGNLDIIIGTHKLLSKDINFKNLGLVIIDEEHRFGVRQKEIFKNLRPDIDFLSLTATPIPRTLSMSLEGIRDFSIITTPPQKRLPIKTIVNRQNKSIIKEALKREIRRGGQVYFLHNEINTINNKKILLEEIFPNIRIGIAHGQMPEKNLENIMRDFCNKNYDVLLCTTIIETGIDIPNANTIIINRADTFGLAQLHQLRGRVGRSYHQAYAYLLTPEEDSMTTQAKRRLEAIQTMDDLGSGFYLALHDLEIRGTGEILGKSQSGNMQEIGYSLYNEILSRSILSLKENGKVNINNDNNFISCDINLNLPALIPTDYCSDIPTRLTLYKRLSHAKNDDDLFILKNEIEDRFGKIPNHLENLIITHRLRIIAEKIHIIKIVIEELQIILTLNNNENINLENILKLTQTNKNIKIHKNNKIIINSNKEFNLKIQELFRILHFLKEN